MSGEVRAAGALLWRPRGGDVEVGVIHRPKYDDWTLPKGKAHRDEALPVCAVREVAEETGLTGALGRSLGQTSYVTVVDGVEQSKLVRYWAMRVDGSEFRPNAEVDELSWVSPGEARRRLSYERDRPSLDRFESAEPATTTVLLVRHASAGDPEAWSGDDGARPLDAVGVRQAAAVTEVLACYGVGRVVTADVLRCEQTVLGLAARVGVALERDPRFSEAGYWPAPHVAVDRLLALAGGGVAVAVCSQGDAIADLVRRLEQSAGLRHPASGSARKGSVWALSFAGARLVDADYLPQLVP